MTRMTKTLFGLAALVALGGCTGLDPGTSSADLAWVDASELSDRADLYIDPTVSWRPTTLDALGGDVATAIPVEVQVYGEVAVAWARRDLPGAAADPGRSRADIVGLFRVFDTAEVTAINDPTVREDEPPTYTPGEGLPTLARPSDVPTEQHPGPTAVRMVLVNFIDVSHIPIEEDPALWRELAEDHPGCLE